MFCLLVSLHFYCKYQPHVNTDLVNELKQTKYRKWELEGALLTYVSYDLTEAVKQATQKHLLQGWLRFAEGNVLELLHRLDVENSSEVAVSVLNALFSVTPLNELAEICKHNDNRYIKYSLFEM